MHVYLVGEARSLVSIRRYVFIGIRKGSSSIAIVSPPPYEHQK